MKKRNSRLLACALAVVLCMTAFSIPTFAAGYYASNENGNNTPPDAIESITVSTENVNLPANSSASGIPALTPDGNLTSIFPWEMWSRCGFWRWTRRKSASA